MEPSGRNQLEVATAAHALLDRLPINDVVPALRAIAKEAGKAAPTVSRIFGDDRHRLVTGLASRSAFQAGPDLIEQMAGAVAFLQRAIRALPDDDKSSAERMIGAEAKNHFLLLMADQQGFRRQMLFAWAATWPSGSEPGPKSKRDAAERDEFRVATTDFYDSIMSSYTQLYGQLLETWGRTLRAPHTIDSVAIVLTALVEGLCLRTFTDENLPTEEAADLFATAVTDFLAAVTDPSDERREISDPTG